jgi:hypothetical protein
MFNGAFFCEELRMIFETLSEMENRKNRGWYSSDLPGPAKHWFPTESRYDAICKATMFYRAGHGWRLRKKTPKHWRVAFLEMFPGFDVTSDQSQIVSNVNEIPF